MNFGYVLVTGGAGFLGSQLVRWLLPVSEHIVVIDDLSTGKREALPVSDKVTFYHGSITDEPLLDEVLPRMEVIFHLACRNLMRSVDDIDADFHTNCWGGFLLLQKTQQHCTKLKKMIYTSTASVYGNAPILPTPEDYFQIKLPYSASKFAIEQYCQVYNHLYQMPVSVLRLSNVYGPGQTPKNPYCGVVSKFFEAIRHEQPLTIYGDGTQTRDFTYVDDVMAAILRLADSSQFHGNIYNVGTGVQTSVLQLADAVLNLYGYSTRTYPLQFQPKRVVDSVQHRAVDIRAIQRDLGWQPEHSLPEGLRKTFRWFTSQS